LQYKNRLDDVARQWQRAGFKLEGAAAGGSGDASDAPGSLTAYVPVPRHLFLGIQTLVRDHEDARERPEEAAIRLFESCAPENRGLRDTMRPLVLKWLEVTEWFQRKAHDSGRLDMDVAGEDDLLAHFKLFEATLGALVRGFFATIEGLDEILEDANE
jgi:hypothetical protein